MRSDRRCYWVEKPRLMAGAYPGNPDPDLAARTVREVLDDGIRAFVNLMEEDEVDYSGKPFTPYEPPALCWAREQGAELHFQRFPIADCSTPKSCKAMHEILCTIEELVARGPVYVHCWGGRGRTGTVVGAWLIRRGTATAEDFVKQIASLRVNDATGGDAPENPKQIDFVREYARWLASARSDGR